MNTRQLSVSIKSMPCLEATLHCPANAYSFALESLLFALLRDDQLTHPQAHTRRKFSNLMITIIDSHVITYQNTSSMNEYICQFVAEFATFD